MKTPNKLVFTFAWLLQEIMTFFYLHLGHKKVLRPPHCLEWLVHWSLHRHCRGRAKELFITRTGVTRFYSFARVFVKRPTDPRVLAKKNRKFSWQTGRKHLPFIKKLSTRTGSDCIWVLTSLQRKKCNSNDEMVAVCLNFRRCGGPEINIYLFSCYVLKQDFNSFMSVL